MPKCKFCKGLFDFLPYDDYCPKRTCMEMRIDEISNVVFTKLDQVRQEGQKEATKEITDMLQRMVSTMREGLENPIAVSELPEEPTSSETPVYEQIAAQWLSKYMPTESGMGSQRMFELTKLLSAQWNAGFNAGLTEDR